MKSQIMITGFVLTLLFIFTINIENGNCTELSPAGAIKKLLKAAEVGTDYKFRLFLESYTHRKDMTAPKNLRTFLASMPVFRSDYNLAYQKNHDSTTLIWWFNDTAMKGSAIEMMELMKQQMLRQGFKQTKSDNEDVDCYSLESKGILYEVRIKQPGNFTGSKFPACGTQIIWKAILRERSSYLSLKQLLAAMPILKDSRIDQEIYDSLSEQKIASLSIGGTWSMYYTWQAELMPDPGQDLLHKVRDLAKNRDFGTYTRENDYDVFCREKTMSYIYIYTSQQDKNITIRIQPQS